jgi:hypothetical protein
MLPCASRRPGRWSRRRRRAGRPPAGPCSRAMRVDELPPPRRVHLGEQRIHRHLHGRRVRVVPRTVLVGDLLRFDHVVQVLRTVVPHRAEVVGPAAAASAARRSPACWAGAARPCSRGSRRPPAPPTRSGAPPGPRCAGGTRRGGRTYRSCRRSGRGRRRRAPPVRSLQRAGEAGVAEHLPRAGRPPVREERLREAGLVRQPHAAPRARRCTAARAPPRARSGRRAPAPPPTAGVRSAGAVPTTRPRPRGR